MSRLSDIYCRVRSSQLFKDSFWALLGSALGKGLALIAGIAIARMLGSEQFGEYGLIRNTLTYIAIVSTFGLGYSATKFIAEYVKHKPEYTYKLAKRLLQITLITGCCFALVQFIFAEEIAIFIAAPHLNNTIRNFSPLIIFNAQTTTQLAILSGTKQFKVTAKINTVTGIIIFFASCFGTYFWGLNGALAALLLSFVVQTIISQYAINKSIPSNDSDTNINVSFKDIRPILSFSLPIALQDSLYAITHWMSTYIIIMISNYHEVGIISAAATWQSIVIFVPAMLKNVMFSHLSSSTQHTKLVKRFLLINLIATATPVLLISIASNFIETFYGASFQGLSLVIFIMCFSAIFISLGEVYVYALLSIGKSWFVFMSRLLRDVLTLGCAYMALNRIGSDYALTYAIIALIIHIVYLITIFSIYKTQKKDV